jgi:hypothetical protein
MSWNFPYWQDLQLLHWLKSASATQCGIEIEKWFNKIGTPD